MNQYYKSLWQGLSGICLFKKGPQDLERLANSLPIYFLLYFFSGVLLLSLERPIERAILQSLVEVVLLSSFSYLILWFFAVPARLPQTLLALYGCGTIMSCLSLPLIYSLSNVVEGEPVGLAGILLISLVVWSLLITAYIFSKAIDKKMPVALLITFSYFYLSFALVNIIYPITA